MATSTCTMQWCHSVRDSFPTGKDHDLFEVYSVRKSGTREKSASEKVFTFQWLGCVLVTGVRFLNGTSHYCFNQQAD